MKTKTIISIVLAIVVVVGGGIVAKKVIERVVDSPKNVVKEFEQAYNDVNVSGMVKCFEPQVQSMYETVDAVASSYFGIGIEDMVNDVLFLAPLVEEYSDEDFFSSFPKLEIDIHDVDKDGDTATVYCTVTVYSEEMGKQSENGSIQLVKVDGIWYISAEEIMGNFGN